MTYYSSSNAYIRNVQVVLKTNQMIHLNLSFRKDQEDQVDTRIRNGQLYQALPVDLVKRIKTVYSTSQIWTKYIEQ